MSFAQDPRSPHGVPPAPRRIDPENNNDPHAWVAAGLPLCREPAGERCYVRFGDLPVGGRFVNFRSGAREPAVSVYRGIRTEGGEYVVDLQNSLGLACIFVRKHKFTPAYLVEGEVVGIGGAGEPVMEVAASRPIPKSRVRPNVALSEWLARRAMKVFWRSRAAAFNNNNNNKRAL